MACWAVLHNSQPADLGARELIVYTLRPETRLQCCQTLRGTATVAQTPLVASNRVGTEEMSATNITFYGGSFIAGPTGEIRTQVRLALYSASGLCCAHAPCSMRQHCCCGVQQCLLDISQGARWEAPVHVQIGKKTDGEMIDPHPERKEGFAVVKFDLEAVRWQRARCAALLLPSFCHAGVLLRFGT